LHRSGQQLVHNNLKASKYGGITKDKDLMSANAKNLKKCWL